MSVAIKSYPLRIPAIEHKKLLRAQAVSGQSMNKLITLCVQRALPDVLELFTAKNGRVTNVNPLPDAEWKKIYRRRDELHGVPAKKLMAFQSQEKPE